MITLIFRTLFSIIASWRRYNICFCETACLFALGLVFSYKLVDFAIVSNLITYFTDDVSQYHLRKAAEFVNFNEGISGSFAIVVILSTTLFSHVKTMISFSIVCYISGLVLLNILASKIVAKSNFDQINIIGIVLLAVGDAGLRTFLREFFAGQLRAHEPKENKNEDRIEARRRVWWTVAWCCSVAVSFLVISNFSWQKSFTFSASLMAGTFLLFLMGIPFYHGEETADFGNGSSYNRLFTIILRVVKCRGRQDQAAVVESSIEQENVGRVCTVTEVKKSKILLKLLPMCITCLLFGLLLSTGKTFFPEQESNLDSTSYGFYILLLLQTLIRHIISYLYGLIHSKWVPKSRQTQAKIVRILAGLALSACCFAVAWRVEDHRLQIVFDNEQKDEPNYLWLVPQFCLLGLSEGFVTDGLEDFMIDVFPESMHKYVTAINELFIGGNGSFLSVFVVYANRILFAATLNLSRLDKYYMRIMIVGIVNFFYSCFVLIFFYRSCHTGMVDDNSSATIADAA